MSNSNLVNFQHQKKVLTSIFALTAFTGEEQKKECALIGMKKVLAKPLKFEQLHEVMWKYFFDVSEIDYPAIYQQQFNKEFE